MQTEQDIELREDVVDLRDTVGPVRPCVCPECGTHGHLDRICTRTRLQTESCEECGCRWQRSLDDEDSGIEVVEAGVRAG